MQSLFRSSLRQAVPRVSHSTPRAAQAGRAGLIQQRYQSNNKPDRANPAVQGGEVGPSDEPPVTSEDEMFKKEGTDEGGIAGEQGRRVQDTEDVESPPEGKGKMSEEQQPHAGRQG